MVFFCPQKPFIFVRHYIAMFLWPGYQEYKTIALWRHFLNSLHAAWLISWTNPGQTMFAFSPTSMRSFLGKLFRSYYIRLRMCAATASIDRIELHASLTNRMRDSRNRFVYSWQLRCFLGLMTSKSAAIAFPGVLNANQRRKIKFGSFASIWKKDRSTDLE